MITIDRAKTEDKKSLLDMIKHFIHHRTDNHVLRETHYDDLHYTVYRLYRVDKIFSFDYHVLIDTTNSLTFGEQKKGRWLIDYPNLKRG
jgi:hypothetical protein